VTEENPQLAQPEDAQEAIWNLPVDSEERRKLAEITQSLPAQSEDAQQAAAQPFSDDPAEEAVWNLPVDSEERRKLAETVQSLRFQHDAPKTDAD
jgi:predicted metal-dependent hydrolase